MARQQRDPVSAVASAENGVRHGVLVPISALTPHPDNYNVHPEAQLDDLRLSLIRFGQVRSIVVQEGAPGRYLIVAGHGLTEAATSLGFTELSADVIPANWSHEQVVGYLVGDNELARLGQVDEAKLADLIQRQRDAGYDLHSLGSSDEAFAAMMERLAAQGNDFGGGDTPRRSAGDPNGGGDDFDTTPPSGPTRCRPGDLWQLGGHRLLIGDSTLPGDVRRLMGGQRATMMWTDPPYGVSYVGKTKQALTIENDGAEGLDALLRDAFAVADEVALTPGAALYISHPAGALSVTFAQRFLAQGWRLHETLVWVKDSMVLGHSDYHYQHEPILFGYKPGGSGRRGRGGEGWYGDNSQTSVFLVPRPKRSEEHPTQKPIPLIAQMMANSSAPGHNVYEPFCGSGSTLIAAERLGRHCFALEISPSFGDVILSRWETESGRTAVLLERLDNTESEADDAGNDSDVLRPAATPIGVGAGAPAGDARAALATEVASDAE